MKSVIVCVRDSAMNGFAGPMAVPTIGVALRSFGQQVNSGDPNSQLAQSPQDFELWHLADFEDEIGEFSVPEGGQRMLARAVDLKASTQ